MSAWLKLQACAAPHDAVAACLDLWAKTFYPGLEASPSVVAFLSGVGQGEGQD